MEKILDLQNQSSLAKLLATENITVTHSKSLSTAYFDVKNRVLGLPVWKDHGKLVYDMLVGHEVSHALYTPHKEFSQFIESEGRAHFDILNIVEDIRIERLIKKKYAGMPRIFNGAYKELVKADFFNIADKNLSELNFLDRLNLHAKVGPYANIPLSDEELNIYNKCMAAETFEDVIALYHEIKEYADNEAKEKEEAETNESNDDTNNEEENSQSESDDSSMNSDEVNDDGEESFSNTTEDAEDTEEESKETSEGIESEDVESDKDEDDNSDIAPAAGADDEVEHVSETLRAFDENAIDDDPDTKTAIALWPTKKTIENHIVPYKTVLSKRPDVVKVQHRDYYNDIENADRVARSEAKYAEMKKNINKKVAVLVREFERRKAAYQYSRAQESRRGSLDVNSLHKYKYDDQIFQTTMRLADSKSHGMIFFIDYSGSMSRVIKDVLEHTLNLIHFCKKVGIPFEVYSFTSNWLNNAKDLSDEQTNYEFNMSNLIIAQLFSSDMSKAEYEKAFKQVSYQIMSDMYSQEYSSPYETLGGTPLDATLIAANHIVNKFNKKHAVQKTNVVVLSDGDSQKCLPKSAHFRCREVVTNVGGKQFTIPHHSMTTTFVEILKKTTNATTIGWFLPTSRSAAKYQMRRMDQYDDAPWKKYLKDGFYHAAALGYDSYFLLNSNIEIDDSEFEFNDTSDVANSRVAQNKLARQYAKHNVKARQSRIILTKFAEIIA